LNRSVVWIAGRNEGKISVVIDAEAFGEGVFLEESVAVGGWRAIDSGGLSGGAGICGNTFSNVGHVGGEVVA
jgi:hypothetical protein